MEEQPASLNPPGPTTRSRVGARRHGPKRRHQAGLAAASGRTTLAAPAGDLGHRGRPCRWEAANLATVRRRGMDPAEPQRAQSRPQSGRACRGLRRLQDGVFIVPDALDGSEASRRDAL